MSIKLYTGLQGSGKSYEVVSVVILGALREGRRVISNIAGLDYVAMRAMLVEEGTEAANVGTLVQVHHDDIQKANFFRTDTDNETKTETFIAGGDVVVLDEIWRFWEKDSQVTTRQQNFFRMHRHMLHPDSGLSCEIVLISQDHMDVCRKIRAVVEKTYVMTKHTELGTTKYYRVDIFSRAKFTKSTEPLNSLQKAYNEKYFPLYKSHSAGGDVIDPKEVSIDKRGNIFSRPIIKYGIPLALLPMLPAFYFLWHWLHPTPQKADIKTTQPSQIATLHPASAPIAAPTLRPETAAEWRVVGNYSGKSNMTFVVQNAAGQVRFLQNPPNYKLTALTQEVELPEGGFATSFASVSGSKEGGSVSSIPGGRMP
jgi:zona occludens toxin